MPNKFDFVGILSTRKKISPSKDQSSEKSSEQTVSALLPTTPQNMALPNNPSKSRNEMLPTRETRTVFSTANQYQPPQASSSKSPKHDKAELDAADNRRIENMIVDHDERTKNLDDMIKKKDAESRLEHEEPNKKHRRCPFTT